MENPIQAQADEVPTTVAGNPETEAQAPINETAASSQNETSAPEQTQESSVAGLQSEEDWLAEVQRLENTPDEPPPGEEAQPTEEAAATTEEAEEGAAPEEGGEPTGEAEEPDAEDDRPLPERVRLKHLDETDRKVIAISKELGVSLEKALQIVKGTATDSQEEAGEAPDPDAEIAEAEQELAELRAQRKAAFAGMEFDKIPDIDDQIDAKRDLIAQKRQEKAVAEERARIEAVNLETRSKARAVELYPDAAVKDSALVQKMIELDAALKETGNPLYHSPEKPLKLAMMAANELGIPPRVPGRTAAKPKSPLSKPVTQTVAPTSKPTVRTTPVASASARTSQPGPEAAQRQHEIRLDEITDSTSYLELVDSL